MKDWLFTLDIFGDDDKTSWMVEEPQWRGIAVELEELHYLKSARILLNMTVDYNARLLASDIKSYFEYNPNALEVLIFKGKKVLSIDRDFTLSPQYHKLFRKRYEK